MLKDSLVKLKNSENSEVVNINQVMTKYNQQIQSGGNPNLNLLTYSPLTKKFLYQTPSIIHPINNISKVISLELEIKKDELFTVLLDVTTKLLVKTNGMVTTLTVGALGRTTGNIQVAFVKDNNENSEIEFVTIKKVSDPIDDARKIINKASDNESKEVKKRGRPKKSITESSNMLIQEFEVVRMETKDGSLFVCDNLIMK